MERLIILFRRWLERERDIKYLSGIKAPAMSDLGVPRYEALELAAGPLDVPQRMHTMAHAHGLSDLAISRNRWRNVEMLHTCARCSSRAECAKWMNDENHAVADAGFCPNTAHFEELVVEGEAVCGAS